MTRWLLLALLPGCWGPEFIQGSADEPTAALEGGSPEASAELEAPDARPLIHHRDAGVDAPYAVERPDAAPDAAVEAGPPTPVQECLATCTGCCDLQGICNVGNTNDVCGTRVSRADGMCVDCVKYGAYCNADQECSIVSPDGGRYVP